MDEQRLTPYLDNIRQTEMPDMEEVNGLALTIDDTYGPMQLMTYLAAGEGDIYLLPPRAVPEQRHERLPASPGK